MSFKAKLAEEKNESDREGLRKAQRGKRRREKSFLIFPFAILFAKKSLLFHSNNLSFYCWLCRWFLKGTREEDEFACRKRQKGNPKIKLLCKIKFLFQNHIPFWTVEFRRFHGDVAAEAETVRPNEIYGKWLCRKIWISLQHVEAYPRKCVHRKSQRVNLFLSSYFNPLKTNIFCKVLPLPTESVCLRAVFGVKQSVRYLIHFPVLLPRQTHCFWHGKNPRRKR